MSKPESKAFDFVAHEAKIDKLIKQSFTSASMSNAAWRKCIKVLNEVAPEMQVIWKFVGSKNDGVRHSLPPNEAVEEKYLTSRFWFGPLYYKEIEWLEFPEIGKPYGQEKVPGAHFKQNVDAVVEALNSKGKWHMVQTELGVRLCAYQ